MRIYGLLTTFPLALALTTPAQAQIQSLPSQTATPKPTTDDSGFVAPDGQLGAGLTFDDAQRGRVYGDIALMHKEPGGGTHFTSLTFLLGGAFKVIPSLEIEAFLPFGWVQGGGGGGGNQDAAAVANAHVGASYLTRGDHWRLKIGGAVEWGPWAHDLSIVPTAALTAGYAAWGGQDRGLWAPDTFTIVAPARFEYGDTFVATADASIGLHIPTNGGDTELSLQIAPGFGYYVTDALIVGARFPFAWVPTADGDNTFVSEEPYLRYNFGPAYVSTRVTVNLDQPFGFGFDSVGFWAWHVAGGASF
ncbi:MAG TPA: hypothetical protein VMI54_21765 [Polyangiaceae bacterium]|nr:hypothetical protein [Polyangiaceae bacterium]